MKTQLIQWMKVVVLTLLGSVAALIFTMLHEAFSVGCVSISLMRLAVCLLLIAGIIAIIWITRRLKVNFDNFAGGLFAGGLMLVVFIPITVLVMPTAFDFIQSKGYLGVFALYFTLLMLFQIIFFLIKKKHIWWT